MRRLNHTMMSNKGSQIAHLDGYCYRLDKVNKAGTIKFFRCMRHGCKGRADMLVGTDILVEREGSLHNHLPDPDEVEKRELVNEVKKLAKNSDMSAADILQQIIDASSPQLANDEMWRKKVTRIVHRTRGDTTGTRSVEPVDIARLQERVLQLQQQEQLGSHEPQACAQVAAVPREPVLLSALPNHHQDFEDLNDDDVQIIDDEDADLDAGVGSQFMTIYGESKFVVFFVDNGTDYLTSYPDWSTDGYFDNVPMIPMQMVCISALKDYSVFPSCFIFLQDRAVTTYEMAFQRLRYVLQQNNPGFVPRSIMTGNDKATKIAVQRVFPTTEPRVNMFNFSSGPKPRFSMATVPEDDPRSPIARGRGNNNSTTSRKRRVSHYIDHSAPVPKLRNPFRLLWSGGSRVETFGDTTAEYSAEPGPSSSH